MMTLEQRGHFWWEDVSLPGDVNPANASGLLKISDDGTIDLELDSVLPSGKHPAADTIGERDYTGKYIRGILKDSSTFVLLCDLHRNGSHYRTHGISYHSFRASRCLVGAEALTRPSMLARFSKLEIELSGFERWLWLNSIQVTNTTTEFSAQYRKPDDLAFPVDGGSLHVHYKLIGPWGPQRTDAATLREVASLIYKSDANVEAEELRNFHGVLSDLFILLTGSNYPLDWPILTAEDSQDTCKLYFPRLSSGSKPLRVGEWWVSFAQISATFGQLFSNWKTKRDELRSGCTLYIATRRNIRLYVEHRFMSLVWGIESLHRRKHPIVTASPKLDAKITRILERIENAKDKKWLAKFLEHAPEPTLETRIYQVLAALDIGLNQASLREFAKQCANARHDVSHFGGRREHGDYTSFARDIYLKSQALTCLYHAVLLSEIGIAQPTLREAVLAGPLSFEITAALKAAGLVVDEPIRSDADLI